MPHEIDIDENDIQDVARHYKLDLSDDARQSALVETKSIDIHAGPGCGKTTLLVAKLAILMTKWRWKDRGICVLSHTNVARQQIEAKAKVHPEAYRILEYPHFVGTLQQFVDRFLALPFVRSCGREVHFVDNARFEKASVNKINLGKNSKLRYALLMRLSNDNSRVEEYVGKLRYSGSNMILSDTSGKPLFKDPNGKLNQQLLALKREIEHEGIFCFEDMYAYAQAYLCAMPELRAAFSKRFPWVFVDELQDTNAIQNEMIRDCFSEGCVIQRLGDQNQAIYDGRGKESSQESLFQGIPLDLPSTIRFGPSLANLASQLTVHYQELKGNTDRRRGKHTIFLFAPDKIHDVLQRFAELIIEEYPKGFRDDFVAKAVGRISKDPGASKANRVPNCISDYWTGYIPSSTKQSYQPEALVDYIRLAQHQFAAEKAGVNPFRTLLDVCVESLRLCSVADINDKAITRRSFRQLLRESEELISKSFFLWCQKACFSINTEDQADWQSVARSFQVMLESIARTETGTALSDFLMWSAREEIKELVDNPDRPNIFLFPSEDPLVSIHVGTIHSVKGENHTATLVLETFFNDHDLKKLVPYLIDQPSSRGSLKDRIQDWMRCIFVGATRPTDLLCLAIRNDHVDDESRGKLCEKGWNLVDI